MRELLLVLDFGGQYKELIAGLVRSLSVYAEIKQGGISANEVKKLNPIGIILTGGPASVYLPASPKCDPKLFSLGIPILGICYGMHLMCHMLGGLIKPGETGEYGSVPVTVKNSSVLFRGSDNTFDALMSHRDIVLKLPKGFTETAATPGCIAACENKGQKLYGLQFHPETKHTIGGNGIIKRFLYDVCCAAGDYKLGDYMKTQIDAVRQIIGGQKIFLALSGGVDSTVCAALLSKAVANRLFCVFVDHGFMRLNEGDEIEGYFSKQPLIFKRVNAEKRFLTKIKGIKDPELKRKRIGEEFIRVFEEEAGKLGGIPFFAQGTIYPDIVESGGGQNSVIKSHHNVGGLPENHSFGQVIEPLSGLFKDEVRMLGKKLGLPNHMIYRQPFPGPGLAIRIMGEVTEEKLDILRISDAITREEIAAAKRVPSQYFAVLTDTYTVGVKGDSRTYDPVVAIRAVTTDDFMTCNYAALPHSVLNKISQRITREVPSVSRVVYDITSKPPATVEWE